MNYFAKSRVEAFSDGVFAIIVTLLVLEIKVPHLTDPTSVGALASALGQLLPKVASWVVSFLMVCVIWVNHHRLLNQLAQLPHGVFWLNAALLLWCSFIPFPTALLGDYLANPLASTVFGGVMLLMALTFTAIRWYAQHYPQVLRPDVDHAAFRAATRRSLRLGPLLYGCGAAAGWLNPLLALGIFALVPILFIFAPGRGDDAAP